ncbi:MAG: cupin domain-containing protein [Vicinamibacteria bacterium]
MRSLVSVVFLASAGAAWAQAPAAGPAAHTVIAPGALQWGPAPPALPKGASVALLSGKPAEPGPYVLRVKLPAGYVIKPHWHPTDENLTVLSGEIKAGMGDAVDEQAAETMAAGAYARMPATMRHYVIAVSETVVQVHGTGPFTLTYVNPADDPRLPAPPPAR